MSRGSERSIDPMCALMRSLSLHEACRNQDGRCGFFRTACVPHHFLQIFGDGFRAPTTDRARRCHLKIESGHRRSESCQGCVWHRANSSRFRCCQRPYYDSVRRLRYRCDWFFTYVSSGLQRRGVCRDRIELRRYLSSARSWTGREETGRPQSVRLRSDQPVDNVSLTQRRTI